MAISLDTDLDSLIVGTLALVFSVVTYAIGRRQGVSHERERRDHELRLHSSSLEQRSQLEAERLSRESVGKVVDSYVAQVRSARTGGIYAMAEAGVATLNTDAEAREAIRQMQLHTGTDPLGGQRSVLEGVNLVSFFRFVRLNGIRFERVAPADILYQMRTVGIDPAAPV